MVSLERKFDVLHQSIATFTRWLDSCSAQLSSLSSAQSDLESRRGGGSGRGTDDTKLRDLALQYKDMLLKMKVQCGTLQDVTTLCKDIRNETKDDQQVARLAKAYETVVNLSQRFSTTCATAKTQYSKLSSLLQATSGAKNSPAGGLKFLPRSLSQTPKLERNAKTPPPSTPPRPHSVQTHHRALSGSHYQPVFVRPTTFSLDDIAREETGGQGASVRKGLNSQTHRAHSYDSDEDDVKSGGLPKAPVSCKQSQTKTTETRPKETKTRDTKNKVVERKPKETKNRDTKTKTGESGSKTKDAKLAKKVQKKQKENESDPIPEILSLEGSPVIAGRRMFKMPSQEDLDEIRGSCSPNAGLPSDKRSSPELPVFGNRSPDRWVEQPKSSPSHDNTSGTRIKVLPTMKSPKREMKVNTPPPILKPKPTVPKKPQFLKQTSANEKPEEVTEGTTKADEKPRANGKEEEEKTKNKKSRFSKLYVFGGSAIKEAFHSHKKERGGREGGEEVGEREKSPPAVSGTGTKDLDLGMDIGEWDMPGDGRKSPILQGRKGVKVMLKDEHMEIPVLSPRKRADSTKKKTPPPPVAKKPVGLMERITMEKKTDQSAKTSSKNTTHVKSITASTAVPSGTKTTPTAKLTPSSPAKETTPTAKLTPSSPAKETTPTAKLTPSSPAKVDLAHAETADSAPEAAGSMGTSNTNMSQEATAKFGQQKPQQLRIQTFKLDNLARDSVGSASQFTRSRGPPVSLLHGREEPAKPAKPVFQGRGVLSDFQRTFRATTATGVKLEHGEEKGSKERGAGTTDPRGWDRTVSESRTGNLEPESDGEQGSDTDTDMELRPGYNRLSLGSLTSHGSGRYDRLVSKEPSEVKGQMSEARSETNRSLANGNGRGLGEEEDGEDMGQRYYIGGRGRKRWSDESPVTPLQEPLVEGESLKGRLGYLAVQLQGTIQAIAERERCILRSLQLEMHGGEVKAMLALLEVQDFELVRLRAQFSPSSKHKFGSLANLPASRWQEFPPEEVKSNHDEIVKLSERIQLLEKHCRDGITQVEEVIEFVLLFETDVKLLTDFLSESKEKLQLSREMGGEHLEDAWDVLTEALAGVNGQRTKLSSVEQLSNHLLYLEPIFDGDCVRGDMQHLSTEYQRVILEVFSQLEALAYVKCEQLLVEMSVVSSWGTEAGLALQALNKRSRQSSGVGDRIAASKELLDSALKKHKTTLISVTKELGKITSLLSPADHDSLRELVYQVRQASQSLVAIEEGLEMMEFAGQSGKAAASRVKGNGAKSSDSDYAELVQLEDSLKILERKQSRVLPPVPVRNVNGAKANVKESDYSHIEDLNVHGHTPRMKRKALLKPYAQVSMRDGGSVEEDEVAMETTPEPPPVPKRPAGVADEKSRHGKAHGAGFLDLKAGQSIRDFPLPPRPDEIKGPRKFSPSPHPPPTSGGHPTYDTLPKLEKENDSWSLYDVPRSLVRGESYETYDTPRSLLQQPHPLPENTLLPRQRGESCANTTPQPRQPDGSHDLYDVPRAVLGSSYDVYDVPRTLTRESKPEDSDDTGKTGQSSGEPVLLSSPDDSVFSPPLYDTPRSLLEGHSGQNSSGQGESRHTTSGHGESGHATSGQDDLGQYSSGHGELGQSGSGQGGGEEREASPDMTYDVPRSLLEPPSPLVEFNQMATRHLDRAIHRLPRCSAPYRPDLEGMGEELRGKGAGLRPSSLHEELLQFIIDEWAQIPKESSPPPAEGSRQVVEETACLLGDQAHTEACLAFAREVGVVEDNIRGVGERVSNLRVPREPDLEKVHNGIDHCESMLSQLKKLQVSLNSCNEMSLVVLASLSSSLPHPTSLSPSPPPPPVRITQDIEIWLFDLSTLLQSANLQLSTKLRELRERETLTNSLHRHLQTLSHTLTAANKLVSDRDDVIEVRGHIQQCKEMHEQLSDKSDWVDQLVDEMKKYVSASPQSHACQNLLDQVKKIKEDWEKVCAELAVVPQLEPTLRVTMLRNVAMVINTMENDLPGLEVTTLQLNDVIAKQRKARPLVSKCRQLLSSLQTTEVNLLQTMSPPAGNQGNSSNEGNPEVVGGVDHAQQQKRSRGLQQDCKRIMSELKTLSSLLATSHTLLERLECETQDLSVWVDDTKAALEMGEAAGSIQQHRVKFQAIMQQLLAKQPAMESYQSLVSEVLLLPGDTSEKKKIEKVVLALYADWDAICHQCVPAGNLPLMSPTTPQNTLFMAPQEFEDPLQMVEWLIMLDYKLQPERLVVGDFLHVRRALQDLQLIEAELKSKERIYHHFMKEIEPNNETKFNEDGREGSHSPSPAPLSAPLEDSGEFNPQQGVNSSIDRSPERRRKRFENWSGMESVQEQSGEQDEEDGTETPRIPEHDVHSNKSTPSHTGTKATLKTLERRQLSMETTSSTPKVSDRFPKQHSLPFLLSHASLPQGLPTPPSSLSSSTTQQTPPQSLLSSLSSVGNSSLSLLSRQVSISSSITASLAELLVSGSPGTSMPEDLYQLKLLWSGMKQAIEQKRQRLELIRDLWHSFEEKKEEFVVFLARAETRLREFPVTLAQAMDFGLIQKEIETQKLLLEEVPGYERKLAALNELGQDLATHYHADDSTADLQDVLQDINTRWIIVMESVARHQPEVNLLSQQWAEFYTHYQTFHQWLRNMDTDMANLNPFVSNMATVQMQLIKLKEIQEELVAHEGVMDSIKLLSYKLQGEEGSSCHVNPAAVHSRLESASRRWDHLQKLAQERNSALEESLTDKQQLLTRMADCLSWLQQAEQHMTSQRPLGGDYYHINTQFIAHQSFSQEVQEQTPKMEAVIQAGRSGLLDVQWPLGTPERSRMDSLRSEFSAVEMRWSKIKTELEEWGRLLESLHPEMETFQTLCAECGQRLSEVELRAHGMPPVANRVVMLTQQLEELREFEAGLVVVGNVLERVIATQKKLMQLGARVSGELVELVRRFHERWVEVKKRVTSRYSVIDKAMVKYDPENLGVATLPRGWIREKTRNGTPFYVENKRDGVGQWQHPELSRLCQSMESEYNQPCYPNLAYPAALKLRTLQKRTQLHLLETRIAIQTFQEDHMYNIYNSHKSLSNSDMILVCLGLFEQAERRPAVKTEPLYVNRAVELTAAWIRDVYDITHEGAVTCISFQIAMVCLSQGRLEEKHRCLFRLMARNSDSITLHQLADFLEHLVQIPQNVLATQYCSVDSLDFHATDAFKKFSDDTGLLSLPQFLTWAQTEPLPLSWLAVMHRAAAAETTQHDVRCAVCRAGPPISGFRYRCQQCHNYDMCQSCFWSGGTTHGHDRTKHYMEEYCVVRPSGDDLKDFFRNLQRHMKKRKNKTSSGGGGPQEVLQEHAPQIIGDHSPAKSSGGRGERAKHRHATVSVSSDRESGDPLRRFTSPTPHTTPLRSGGSPSHKPGGGGGQREKREGAAAVQDIDFSLVKITEEDKNVSQTLDTLRRHRERLTSDLTMTPMTTPLRVPNGETPPVATGNKPRPPPAPSTLENRVHVLEDHNTKLEGYISQLKKITSNTDPSEMPTPSRVTPHSNGSPAHLTTRGNPYVRPERKYHYVTVTTPNHTHRTNSSSQYTTTPTHTVTTNSMATNTMATGSPAHSNYIPLSPAQQRMVLQPPALVRNSRHRNPATLL